ncbi:MAG TPA: hypothetical protein VKQ30_14320 [Ktedonobacterales bacterium]|nr:hypothetical protein [Ktedonobacterales bacterium]
MADTKTKAQTSAEQKAENTVNQAATAWSETIRDAGKAVADSAVAMQDRNVQFAQSIIEQGFKQIENQTATLHELYTTVASQSEARRAAFRDLTREAAEAYIGLLASPAKLYRRVVEAARETVTQPTGTEA